MLHDRKFPIARAFESRVGDDDDYGGGDGGAARRRRPGIGTAANDGRLSARDAVSARDNKLEKRNDAVVCQDINSFVMTRAQPVGRTSAPVRGAGKELGVGG